MSAKLQVPDIMHLLFSQLVCIIIHHLNSSLFVGLCSRHALVLLINMKLSIYSVCRTADVVSVNNVNY